MIQRTLEKFNRTLRFNLLIQLNNQRVLKNHNRLRKKGSETLSTQESGRPIIAPIEIGQMRGTAEEIEELMRGMKEKAQGSSAQDSF